ncbi:MAG: hypothetical protein IPP07_09270 [Holophagales bacterium]|jgi:hypothetical protein|nr:hypothetical protein [Holophagales bacterium]MBK9965059.1 hypothetical protein [Holophagales bacterium]
MRKTLSVFAALLPCLALASPAPAAGLPAFDRPGILSSVGQASDIAVVKVLLNTKLKLGLDVKPLAQPADLAGQKVLVVVVGASTKGLGAAGLDIAKEAERAKALLAAAREKKVGVLVLHTGGASRRGKTTDDLIRLVVPMADHVVVVASGNADKIFQSALGSSKAQVVEVDALAAVGDAVKAVFR